MQSNVAPSLWRSWPHPFLKPPGTEKELTSAEDILFELRDGSDEERVREAILFAEVTEFTNDEASKLRGLLRRFIERFGSTGDERTLTVVGAAVRTFVALYPADRLNEVGDLLSPTEPVRSEIENEFGKMIVRKLTAVPPKHDDSYPALAEKFAAMARGYLDTWIIPRACCGPAAMNATLALAMMRSKQLNGVLDQVKELKLDWYRKQLSRRAARLSAELGGKFPPEQINHQMSALARVSELGNS